MNTSYFGNWRNITNPVSISRLPPGYFKGPREFAFAPSLELLVEYKHGVVDQQQYTEIFNAYLDTLDPVLAYQRLIDDYGDTATLLCFEPPHMFCHRFLVSAWLSEHNGICIRESPNPYKSDKIIVREIK